MNEVAELDPSFMRIETETEKKHAGGHVDRPGHGIEEAAFEAPIGGIEGASRPRPRRPVRVEKAMELPTDDPG